MRPQENGVPEPVRSGKYLRYVALGDSQTEGVGDGDDIEGLRGWADRLAEHLAIDNPDLQYANLAVRGRRAGEVRSEQLGPALALRPDVATVVAGVNDLLRLRVEIATVVDPSSLDPTGKTVLHNSVIVFLASAQSNYMTGEVVAVSSQHP